MESEGAFSFASDVQRIFYIPSAVGKLTSHMSLTQTVRRIRIEGHDRQKH